MIATIHRSSAQLAARGAYLSGQQPSRIDLAHSRSLHPALADLVRPDEARTAS